MSLNNAPPPASVRGKLTRSDAPRMWLPTELFLRVGLLRRLGWRTESAPFSSGFESTGCETERRGCHRLIFFTRTRFFFHSQPKAKPLRRHDTTSLLPHTPQAAASAATAGTATTAVTVRVTGEGRESGEKTVWEGGCLLMLMRVVCAVVVAGCCACTVWLAAPRRTGLTATIRVSGPPRRHGAAA